VESAQILEETRGLVAIPVHNEQENLGDVIRELRSNVPSHSILFVNDGSTDDSERILRESGLPYVTHPVNLGYQETLKTGIYAALAGGFSYVVFFDADGQHRIEDLRGVIELHEAGGYDLIVGSRYATGRESGLSTRSVGT
jgi:glycosyltransferase involved in cell wall biosynthesis